MSLDAVNKIPSFDISSLYDTDKATLITNDDKKNDFGVVFESACNLLSNTAEKINAASEEEIKFAAGEDNTLELQLAQNEANTSLSTLVALKNNIISAYKEIMSLQF